MKNSFSDLDFCHKYIPDVMNRAALLLSFIPSAAYGEVMGREPAILHETGSVLIISVPDCHSNPYRSLAAYLSHRGRQSDTRPSEPERQNGFRCSFSRRFGKNCRYHRAWIQTPKFGPAFCIRLTGKSQVFLHCTCFFMTAKGSITNWNCRRKIPCPVKSDFAGSSAKDTTYFI